MSKNVFVKADSFRRLLLGAAGGYELQGHHEAAQTVMHVIDALDELTTGGKGRSQEDEDHYLMDFCHCHLATGNGCPGCPFDKPTSNDGDGECRLGVPSDWDF